VTSRRSFIAALGSGLAGPAKAVADAAKAVTAAPFAGNVGLELYSLRREMAKDAPGTLAQVRAMGFQEVEVAGFVVPPAAILRPQLDAAGLACTSYMGEVKRFDHDLHGLVSEAKALGARFLVLSWIDHQEHLMPAQVDKAVKSMTTWARQVRSEGLRFAYHSHNYEFEPEGQGTLYERIVTETPRIVEFEMDVFWFVLAGQDPVAWLRRHPGRFPLFHLKDARKGTALPTLEMPGHEEASVAVGSGLVDFPALLREAARSGGERYFIEDESSQAAANVPQSLAWLRSLKL
jgi:sugar phosphate isomerase/epimerase